MQGPTLTVTNLLVDMAHGNTCAAAYMSPNSSYKPHKWSDFKLNGALLNHFLFLETSAWSNKNWIILLKQGSCEHIYLFPDRGCTYFRTADFIFLCLRRLVKVVLIWTRSDKILLNANTELNARIKRRAKRYFWSWKEKLL